MSSQLHNRGSATARNPRGIGHNPIFKDRFLNGTVVRLLAAPTVDDKAMWKAQSFDFARDKFRGKLSEKVSADNVIAIIGEHFPVSTMTAEQEARRVIRKFREAFLNIDNLAPSSFLNIEGVDVTGIMYRNPRPENVCHLGVEARIPMRTLSEAFGKGLSEYTISYFLPLPQSFAPSASVHSKLLSENNSLLTVADTMDASLFSPASDRKKIKCAEDVLPTRRSAIQREIDEVNKTPAQGRRDDEEEEEDIYAGYGSGNEGSAAGTLDTATFARRKATEELNEGGTSNDSFKFAQHFHQSPKAATLMQTRKRSAGSAGGSSFTYQEDIGILDDQSIFESVIHNGRDMYELITGVTGKPTVIDRENIADRIARVEDIIQFRVFCHEYRNAYVGTSIDEELDREEIISQSTEALSAIKMRFKCTITRKMVTITPDKVYAKMLVHTSLLPEEANTWPFVLPWVFFNALTPELQAAMRREKYSLPSPTTLLTKSSQINSMTVCRDTSRASYTAILDMHLHIESVMGRSVGTGGRSNHYRTADDEGRRASTSNQANEGELQEARGANFRGKSIAERTMEQGQRDTDVPANFEQKFKNVNGAKFPCHPRDEHLWSRWPVGATGCYGCGRSHDFSDCETSKSRAGRSAFHFDLHCHKPRLWFRYINRNSERRILRKPVENGNGRGRGRDAVRPAWMENANSNRYGPSQPSKSKSSDTEEYETCEGPSAQQYVNVVKSHLNKESQIRRMPISSNNELPHIAFPIGKKTGVATVTALYDTGGALNTGNIYLHNLIKENSPEVVATYEEFDGANPFEPMKLCGALMDPSDYDEKKHGILSAVIGYHTPFQTSTGKAVVFRVALGIDMSVDTIIGIPFIHELALELRVQKPLLIAHKIRMNFSVVYRETVLTKIPLEIVSDESTEEVCANPPRVAFKSDTRLISVPLASLFQAVAQESEGESTTK